MADEASHVVPLYWGEGENRVKIGEANAIPDSQGIRIHGRINDESVAKMLFGDPTLGLSLDPGLPLHPIPGVYEEIRHLRETWEERFEEPRLYKKTPNFLKEIKIKNEENPNGE